MKKKILSFIILFMAFVVFAQERPSGKLRKPVKSKTENSKKDTKSGKTELPTLYRDISLGMNIDEVKEVLKKDMIFGYKGERDISLLPSPNRSLIETAGDFFIKRSWFQFYEEKLYTMIIQMNTERIDYYSIYTKLCEKYNEPDFVDPKKSIWKNDNVELILERPLTIKYIDLKVFNMLLEKSLTEKTAKDIQREDFINDF